MLSEILRHHLWRIVGVAVSAEMRAGVVGTDVLRVDADAQFSLTAIRLCTLQKRLQLGIIGRATCYQFRIDATIMLYAKFFQMNSLSTSGKPKRQPHIRKPASKSNHGFFVPLLVINPGCTKIVCHTAITGNIGKTEYQLLRIAFQLLRNSCDFVQKQFRRNLISKN